MLRALSVFFVAFVTACAGQQPLPPSVTPNPTSTASNAVLIVDQKGEPIVRNGMRARSLTGVARTFAAYVLGMHDRIHPEFSDKELAKLDARLAADDPLDDKTLFTRLELILSTEDGRIVKMRVAKTSGVTAFDIAALDSVRRAQPFGPASRAIASADGNVHVDWEFYRDEVYGCSPIHTQPLLLAP